MNPGDVAAALASGLLAVAPPLVAWIVAIVLSRIIFSRSDGGRAERWLLIGSCLMLIAVLFRIPTVLIVPWLIGGGSSVQSAASITSIYSLIVGVISMAGIISLVYAFWIKFWVGHGAQQRS